VPSPTHTQNKIQTPSPAPQVLRDQPPGISFASFTIPPSHSAPAISLTAASVNQLHFHQRTFALAVSSPHFSHGCFLSTLRFLLQKPSLSIPSYMYPRHV
ncbi:hypothetical protein H1C71_007255, partial [Ictidomys tridecemlineatus]